MNRVMRKKKEYRMAVLRTLCNAICTVITALSFLFTMIVYHKIYFGGE